MDPSEDIKIGFLLEMWLEGVMFNPARAEGISFATGGSKDLHISIAPTHPDDDPFGHRRGITCKVRSAFPASQDQKKFVAALFQRRFTPYPGMPFTLPYVRQGEEQISVVGAMREGFGLPFEAYPRDLRELCDEARHVLFDSGVRFLKLLIWLLQINAPPDFVQHAALYWRVEKGNYYVVGLKRHEATAMSPVGITWDEEDEAELRRLWEADAEESLAHELLREAKTLCESSPRSALLVVATALEVGVKSYIMRVAPQTKGLVDKIPSPPIFRLFRDYLPTLHSSLGWDIPYWAQLKSLFTSCQKLFEDRNDLAHGTAASVEPAKLAAYIETATDLLYLLDVLEGNYWAKAYVELGQRKLGWPGPRHRRTMVSMVTHDL